MAARQRHTIYIRCRPPELWAALTEAQTTRHYYYDSRVDSSFEAGAAIRYLAEPRDDSDSDDPIAALVGEIIAVEPERALVHSFRFSDLDEPATTVRWTLTPNAGPGVVRVEVVHDGFAGEAEAETETWRRVDAGWPVILSGLKTWLETGEALGVAGFDPVEPE